ncbi:MAG: ABC transporter [Actinobacteria bacterium]|nr:ABC transporter [Actinomycetota bacterium]
MSDAKSSYGEPVDESTPVDDVVGRAHEGLAEAEAAQRDAVTPAELDEAAAAPEAPAPAAASAPATDNTPWYDRPDDPDVVAASTAGAASASSPSTEAWVDAEPVASGPIASEPTYVEPAYVAPAVATAATVAPQPIFVQAPEAPRPRGNRGAAGAIGLLAAVAFAVLYLGVWLALGFVTGDVTSSTIADKALAAATSWALWVPVVVFFIAFWLLGAVLNRARWGHWVIFGLLVGVASYGGHILGQLFQAPFWNLTAREGANLVDAQMFAPLAIAAFVIGRELTIWFGAWVSARGKRVTEINNEAQREYERTLEAGPQLVRA